MKWIKPIALALIIVGLLLAGQYGLDSRRSAAAAEQLRAIRARSAEESGLTQGSIQASGDSSDAWKAPSPAAIPQATAPLESTIQSGNVQSPPSSQPTDPFASLRNPLPATGKNPFAELQAINSDLAGWIRIADTRIDYPIVKGRDNVFYLTHGFDRKSSQGGAIFMDYRNIGDGNDANTIIYGHKMKNQSMFQTLLKFADARFYANHRTIGIDTLYGRISYRVFAAYTTTTDFYYIQTRFDQTSHAIFLDGIRKRSEHAWDTDITFDDRILTLSTCSSDFRDARFVVHAKRIS